MGSEAKNDEAAPDDLKLRAYKRRVEHIQHFANQHSMVIVDLVGTVLENFLEKEIESREGIGFQTAANQAAATCARIGNRFFAINDSEEWAADLREMMIEAVQHLNLLQSRLGKLLSVSESARSRATETKIQLLQYKLSMAEIGYTFDAKWLWRVLSKTRPAMAAKDRMRVMRERRKAGFVMLTVPVHVSDLERLHDVGLLSSDEEADRDPAAIADAFEALHAAVFAAFSVDCKTAYRTLRDSDLTGISHRDRLFFNIAAWIEKLRDLPQND